MKQVLFSIFPTSADEGKQGSEGVKLLAEGHTASE